MSYVWDSAEILDSMKAQKYFKGLSEMESKFFQKGIKEKLS